MGTVHRSLFQLCKRMYNSEASYQNALTEWSEL